MRTTCDHESYVSDPSHLGRKKLYVRFILFHPLFIMKMILSFENENNLRSRGIRQGSKLSGAEKTIRQIFPFSSFIYYEKVLF
jgi:phage terminase large subunit-like protein